LSGSVTALSGSLIAEIEGAANPAIWTLNFSPAGAGASMSLSGSDNQSCNVTGTFTQEGSSNVFDVSMTFTGSGCPAGTLSGLGFESNSDYFQMNGGAAGVYLYAASSKSASVFEIFP
jgi:hypothetical protein